MKTYFLLLYAFAFLAFLPKTKDHPTPKLYKSLQPVFSFEYAGYAILETEDAPYPKISFPILEKESDLEEKYLAILVHQGNDNCPNLDNYAAGTAPKNVSINGIAFQRWESFEVEFGNIYEIIEYVTQKEGYCICLRFCFHSVQSGSSPLPFKGKEELIAEVMATIQM